MNTEFRKIASHLGHGRAASEIVADAIRHLIASGNLKPGDRLPVERELAPTLGAARVTVRAAIRMLNEEGLLVTGRGRSAGTVVCNRQTKDRASGSSISVFEAAIAESYEFRMALEPVAAKLAAVRASAAERKALQLLCEQPCTSQASFHALDSSFHLRIAKMSRNAHILDAIERNRGSFFILVNTLFLRIDVSQVPSFAEEHQRIAQAIAGGDERAAGREMAAHIRRSHMQFLQVLSRTTSGVRSAEVSGSGKSKERRYFGTQNSL